MKLFVGFLLGLVCGILLLSPLIWRRDVAQVETSRGAKGANAYTIYLSGSNTLRWFTDNGRWYVGGVLRNEGPFEIRNGHLSFGIYDSDSNKLGIRSESIPILQSGETWKVKMLFMFEEQHRFEMQEGECDAGKILLK